MQIKGKLFFNCNVFTLYVLLLASLKTEVATPDFL